ncbi:MAG: formyltransferase [Burkholderiales bacterium]
MATAVVFGYHNVGVSCLRGLLAHGVDVQLVVTHTDNPTETIWFDSVAKVASENSIPVVTPEDPNTDEFIARLSALSPDFIFSFYYRNMLNSALLATAKRGAFNMHGSLLPKYRGRVPINWAIIKGETETGATLHEMVEKPDAGRIVGQQAVPIGPDETAREVFAKVTAAAAAVLDGSLPKLIKGEATLTPQNLAAGSYFGGRKPSDGVIDWHATAENIHNLVRGVAPPYPGATTQIRGETIKITKTKRMPAVFSHSNPAHLNVANDKVIALCGSGTMLRVLEAEIDGQPYNELMLAVWIGTGIHAMTAPP